MRDEHRRMREEGWGPRPGRMGRPGGPEWRGGPGWGAEDPEWGPGRPGRGRGRGGHGGGDPRGDPRGGGRGGRAWSAPGPFPEAAFALREAAAGMDPAFGLHGFGRHGGPHGGPHRRRARRGDVRAAILDLLAEGQPSNGYQIIQTIAERTNGVWRPSAGSVYPALQQLEDEGLISPEGEGRRRMYTLTDEGRQYAEAHAEELSSSWDAVAGMTDDAALELGDMIRQVMMAVMEVRRAGSASQIAEARRVLTETRRSMYRILADDADDADDAATGAAGTPPGSPAGTAAGTEPEDEPDSDLDEEPDGPRDAG